MKALHEEPNQLSQQQISADTAELVAALIQANDRIRELEESVASMRSELEESKQKKRSRVDFSWLSMA